MNHTCLGHALFGGGGGLKIKGSSSASVGLFHCPGQSLAALPVFCAPCLGQSISLCTAPGQCLSLCTVSGTKSFSVHRVWDKVFLCAVCLGHSLSMCTRDNAFCPQDKVSLCAPSPVSAKAGNAN